MIHESIDYFYVWHLCRVLTRQLKLTIITFLSRLDGEFGGGGGGEMSFLEVPTYFLRNWGWKYFTIFLTDSKKPG